MTSRANWSVVPRDMGEPIFGGHETRNEEWMDVKTPDGEVLFTVPVRPVTQSRAENIARAASIAAALAGSAKDVDALNEQIGQLEDRVEKMRVARRAMRDAANVFVASVRSYVRIKP